MAKVEGVNLMGKSEDYEYFGMQSPDLCMRLNDHPVWAKVTMNLGNKVWPGCLMGAVKEYTSVFCEIKSEKVIPIGEASEYMSELNALSKRIVDAVAKDCIGSKVNDPISFYFKALGLKTKPKPCWPFGCRGFSLEKLDFSDSFSKYRDDVNAMIKEHAEENLSGTVSKALLRFKQDIDKLFKDKSELKLLSQELSDLHGKKGEKYDQRAYAFPQEWFFAHKSIAGRDFKWTGFSTVSFPDGISACLDDFLVKQLVCGNSFVF